MSPDDVVAHQEQRAPQLGLSLTECLRRMLASESADRTTPATLDDGRAFSERRTELDDPEVIRFAWT